jgi:hypothetical protein
MTDGDVPLVLSTDEALVLFEFLSRFSNTGRLVIEDPAEQEVLWGLQCSLEKVQLAPHLTDYQDQLRQARERLRPEPG